MSNVYDLCSRKSIYAPEQQKYLFSEEHYECIWDFEDAIRQNEKLPPLYIDGPRDSGMRSTHGDGKWAGGNTYAEVLNFMNKGWPAGRAFMGSEDVRARLHTVQLRTPVHSFEVAGAYPNVPLAAAGDLQNMFAPSDELIATKPCLQVYSEQIVSSIVSPEAMLIRGAAVCTHIDAIEAAGFPCELTLRYGAKGGWGGEEGKSCVLDICLKRAGDPLDLDKLLLWIAHPGAFRRLVFAYENRRPGYKGLGEYYGQPQQEQFRKVPGGIIIPTANEFTSDYDKIETAVERVRKLIGTGLQALPNMRCDPLREYYVDNWLSKYEVEN